MSAQAEIYSFHGNWGKSVHTIYILDMTEKDNLGDLDVDINI
jgi:hypothetical protein